MDQAERLAARLDELGGLEGHSLLVARDKGTQARPFALLGFDQVTEIEITDSPVREWPYPANNVFQKCAKHIYAHWPAQRWLWIEPDVWPMAPGWLATIAQEDLTALAAGKSFLGDFVSVHTPELDVPDHMSGVGVYPGNLLEYDGGGDLMLCDSIAWDVSGAHIIVPRMHKSELIHHSWKHKAFVDEEQVQREIYEFKPKCVLFHADKTGSLEALRKGSKEEKSTEVVPVAMTAPEASVVSFRSTDYAGSNPAPCINLSGNVATIGESARREPRILSEIGPVGSSNSTQDEPNVPPAQLICDILIKSYPADYPLLEYCLKSLEKFASGFRQVIVIYPEGEPPNLWPNGDPRYKGVPVQENGDGYMAQQSFKANAHEFTDARYITHFDSDCFITRPITPASFFQDGKPIWLLTPYSKIEAPWQASTEKFLGEPVEFEFMRRHPTFVPRSIHVAAAAFCLMKHGVTLKDYIMGQPVRDVSEFNLLGALAYSRAREDFTWIDTTCES